MRNTPTAFALSEALSVYLLDHRASKHSKRTLEHYKTQLTPFLSWLEQNGVSDLSLIRPNHIRQYLIECSDRGLSEHSINTAARAIRAFLNFCVREEWLIKSPMNGVVMPKLPKLMPTILTKEQVKKLIAGAESERDKAIVLVLLDTGMRASELCSLCGRDIDVSNGTLFVRKGKGGKDRMCFIGAKTVKAILRYYAARGVPQDADAVWLSSLRRERLTLFGLAQMLERYGKRLGFQCNAHKLRRTFATECLRSGMDIFTLQRLMGHEDITVLKHYLAILDSDLREAHRRHGVVDNL